ncbi:IS1595 family transposase [Sutterella sp.]|uniref:IS1595 family transposase n=1 Tax=Sutterella sp. TaxID=1981025 RepID=UPI0026DFD998|nr:IS1595 family transposase [Sutterella sp.]MDO5531953.1 IS1595 family transposase [Sutterella sp.]
MTDIEALKAGLLELSDEDLGKLLRELAASGAALPALPREEPRDALDQRRFAGGLFCPWCSSTAVSRFGRQKNGAQRYRCRECGRTFGAATRTVLGRGRRKNLGKLEAYVHCMCERKSLRESARICSISLSTAFAWRHRILDALAATLENAVLTGVVEVDQVLFDLSFKGSPVPEALAGRDARKAADTRVCVPVAVSRSGAFAGRVSNLGAPQARDVARVMEGRVAEGATLTSPDPGLLAGAAEGKHRIVRARAEGASRGGCSTERVRAFEKSLKDFVNGRLHGVATKYLNNYVAWNGFLESCGERKDLFEKMLLGIAETAVTATDAHSVGAREAVPLLSPEQKSLLRDLLEGMSQVGKKAPSNGSSGIRQE